jgi:hypothetical protein
MPRKEGNPMKHRMTFATIALSLSFISAPALLAAPLSGADTAVTAKQGTGKVITVNVQNASSTALTVQAGTQQIVIAPNSTSKLKVNVGTQLVNVTATPTYSAGTLLTTVGSDLDGSLLTIK